MFLHVLTEGSDGAFLFADTELQLLIDSPDRGEFSLPEQLELGGR